VALAAAVRPTISIALVFALLYQTGNDTLTLCGTFSAVAVLLPAATLDPRSAWFRRSSRVAVGVALAVVTQLTDATTPVRAAAAGRISRRLCTCTTPRGPCVRPVRP
jgi:hypothetical protein